MKNVIAVAGLILASMGCAAGEFPTKPIRIVVPNPPGGTVELVARAAAQGMGEGLHQAIVVEPKPGGNNIIGTEAVARAAPDGYTLLLGGTHVTINPLVRKLPYDGLNAFTPVALLAATPNVIAVNASVPVRNVAELIALAKARPLNCATATPGNGIHLAAERFRTRAGIDLNFIPYQGGVQAAASVAAGHAEVLVAPLSDTIAHQASGRVRILAVTSAERMELLPGVPTLAEAGFPGFNSLQWFGALAPAGTPPAVVARLSDEMRRAVDNAEVRSSFAKVGLAVMPMDEREFDAFMHEEMKGFAQIIKDNKIRVE